MLVNNLLFGSKQSKVFLFTGGEKDFHKHYFTKETKIYSDKLSKLVCKINAKSEGKVIDRLVNIFPTIFIDECQDLAGYDLDIIKLMAMNTKDLILVCDPRQVTYLTHNENKYKKYRNGLIEDFINNECKKIEFNIDIETLSHSFRCNQKICDFSNKLYPKMSPCNSRQEETTEHDGIFLVDINDTARYLESYKPVQLRWNISNRKVDLDFSVYNFGQSKGLTFNRVLIYPTEKMLDWMQDYAAELNNEARAKFYVGITRAKYSVGIVCDKNKEYIIDGITKFE